MASLRRSVGVEFGATYPTNDYQGRVVLIEHMEEEVGNAVVAQREVR